MTKKDSQNCNKEDCWYYKEYIIYKEAVQKLVKSAFRRKDGSKKVKDNIPRKVED